MRAIEWSVVFAAVFAAIPVPCDAAKRIAAADGLGGRIEVTCVDGTTGGAIPQPYVTAEPIDTPLPPGQFPYRVEPVDGQWNKFLSSSLAPGRYQLWAERDARNPDDDCYESDRPMTVEVNAGETTAAVVRVSKRRLTSREIEERWPWEVYGRVTNSDGAPVKGAVVRAFGGLATLYVTGAAESNADGEYRLRFAQGVWMEVPWVHSMLISADMPGMYETNLNQQGQLAAAEPNPKYGRESYRADQIIEQGQARRLDFTLAPAADLHVQFRTERRRDEKLDGLRVSLEGNVMPPGCSVVDDGRADRWGWIAFAGVPLNHEWFLEIESDGESLRTQPFRLTEAQPYSIKVCWRRDATGLEVLDIESIEDALGRDVTLQLAGDEPLKHPPAPASGVGRRKICCAND